MVQIETFRTVDSIGQGRLLDLLDAAAAGSSQPPLSDQFALLLSHRPELLIAVVAGTPDGADCGAMLLHHDRAAWRAELLLAIPDVEPTVLTALVGAAMTAVAQAGGGTLDWWVSNANDQHDLVAEQHGLVPGRAIFQMTRQLPLSPEQAVAGDVPTRSFEVDRDEIEWLRVNNAAFAWHPEQGGWTIDTLRLRQAEPWFDPSGFLLHERDGVLAAFCWTKQHSAHQPPVGEIYVIAVDPAFHGLGLGRALTVAGLNHLAGRGIATGMLYVDADNTSAVGLYRALGFSVHHTDRAFSTDVPPSSKGSA